MKGYWLAIKRIFKYLKGTFGARLEFSRSQIAECVDYCDADWGNDNDNGIRRSIMGSIFSLSGRTDCVAKQKAGGFVVLSTTEVEYMALLATCQEALRLRALAKDLEPSMVLSPMIVLGLCISNFENYKSE